jgi:hypothetical protein
LEGADRALAHEQIVLNSLEGVKYYYDILRLYYSTTCRDALDSLKRVRWVVTAQS